MESVVKRKGKHPTNALSAIQVRNEKRPGWYADGGCLYLVVDDNGAKRWVLRTTVNGRRRDIGLGSVSVVSLAQAREAATESRRLARAGGDPAAQRRREKGTPTFAEAARNVHKQHAPSWRNAKHAAQWLSTLETFVIPVIGDRRVDAIDAPDILKILLPIWLSKPETARRVRQRIRTVFDWAKAAGYRPGENPVAGISKGLPKQPKRDGHHAALAYADVPSFIQKLRDSDASEIVRLALEFTILTAARTGEVLGMRRHGEVKDDLWTVPPERMKANREHRVPLTTRGKEIIARAQELMPDEPFMFPGRSSGERLSDMALLMVIRRLGYRVTTHGFRSSFRDWASERTNFPREVCEAALAHSIEDKTEAAYRRGDLFEKRRKLMDAWSACCTAGTGKIVVFHAARP